MAMEGFESELYHRVLAFDFIVQCIIQSTVLAVTNDNVEFKKINW